ELVATKVSYIVQEATVVIKNIFRKYPNQYESIISTLCENLDSLDEPEAKAAMIWVIGQYADRIENSEVLLEDFLDTWPDETHEVQLALLTATVKLFIQRPTKGQDLVPKVLKWATEDTDNPDLRDRGYMYWRLLSSNPTAAKSIVMGDKPAITAESEKLDPVTLEEMCLVVGTLATVYLKPVHSVFRSARPRRLQESPALQKDSLPSYQAMQQAKLIAEANGTTPEAIAQQQRSQAGWGQQNGDVLDEADAYFASVGGGGPGQSATGFAGGPMVGGPSAGGADHVAGGGQMYIVNQGQGLGTVQPTMHVQSEGDLLGL
ncbi:Adaptor protein complex beta subunit, partial [Hortaea werneckii]